MKQLSLTETITKLRSREISSVELTQTMFETIKQRNGGEPTFDGDPKAVNAWARLYPERALEQARQADELLDQEGENAPTLCGVPWGVKDMFPVSGLPVTASSKVLADNTATSSAPVVEHLERHGMVLLGHTHTHEFAAGGSTDQVGNPWDVNRSAGGSSGGSGAAVAANMTPVSIGTDTAGSIRIPAALCGVSSIKPSFGTIPTAGVIPLSPSLDHVGPMGRTVADCAVFLRELFQTPHAPMPWLGWQNSPDGVPVIAADTLQPLAGKRIAVTERNMSDRIDTAVLEALDIAITACERLGATIVRIPAPAQMEAADYDTITMAEARAYHAQYASKQELYRPSIRDFVAFDAPEISANQYLQAQTRRIEVTQRWHAWFVDNTIDAVLEPTVAKLAPVRGAGYESHESVGAEDPMTLFTAMWNYTGFPAVTMPTHLDAATQLPVSVSFIAGPGQDARAVEIALAVQHYELPALMR